MNFSLQVANSGVLNNHIEINATNLLCNIFHINNFY